MTFVHEVQKFRGVQRLFLAILLAGVWNLTSCRTTETAPEAGLKDTPPGGSAAPTQNPFAIFQVPGCLPQCSSSDQQQLAANSPTEAAIVKAIGDARETVDFSMYTFSRKPIFDALVDAARRGVRVRGVVDRAQFKTTSDLCKPGGCSFPDLGAAWLTSPIETRLERVSADPMWRDGSNTDKLAVLLTGLATVENTDSGVRPAPGSDRLVHNKYVLVDRKILLSGSGNWSSTAVSVNLENLMRFERESSPEILDGIICSFELFWQGDSNTISQNIGACQREDLLYLSPAPRGGPQPRIIKAINDATVSIDIAMHHLVDPDSLGALRVARERGVRIRIATDDDHCNARADRLFHELLAAGAEVRYVPTSCSIFQLSHSKYGIFDDSLVINGSANWSRAGLRRNYENFTLMRSSVEVSAFRSNFQKLWELGVPGNACQCDRTLQACREKYCMDRPR